MQRGKNRLIIKTMFANFTACCNHKMFTIVAMHLLAVISVNKIIIFYLFYHENRTKSTQKAHSKH